MTDSITFTRFVCILLYAGMSRARLVGLRRFRWLFTRRPGDNIGP